MKVLESIRNVKSLKDERERGVVAANTGDGSLKEEEGSLLDGGGDLSSKAACLWGFVADHTATRLLDRLYDGFDIPGQDSAEIDEFARDTTCLTRLVASLGKDVHLRAPTNDGDVVSFAHDASLAKRDLIITNGDVFNSHAIKKLWFKEYNGIGVSDRGQEKALCFDWGAGHHNLLIQFDRMLVLCFSA